MKDFFVKFPYFNHSNSVNIVGLNIGQRKEGWLNTATFAKIRNNADLV